MVDIVEVERKVTFTFSVQPTLPQIIDFAEKYLGVPVNQSETEYRIEPYSATFSWYEEFNFDAFTDGTDG